VAARRASPGGNILQVNLKSKYSPYVVVDPRHVAIDCYAGEIIRERSMFPWWNHWPVSQPLQLTLRASADSPVVNPALVIRNWGLSPSRVEIDGQGVPAGNDLRLGAVHRLEGDDLVVWIRKDATAPLRITVAPAGRAAARRTQTTRGTTTAGAGVGPSSCTSPPGA
jgi:hypothetical protein